MNREDIIAMVQEAVIAFPNQNPFDFRLIRIQTIERFAALVAAHEREACSKVCEALGNDAEIDEIAYLALREADEAIRARGEEVQS
jgi:hypothetical protein